MLRTRLCELLNIEAPILGAPMGPEISGLELAAAVSNAGGLGMISFGGYPPPALRERIGRLRKLTSRPFAVNVLLGGPQLPFAEADLVRACLEERVPVLSFFWGDPTRYVEDAHKAGVKVCDQVGSVVTAKRARDAGVDFIIAQGVEAGGHIAGTVGTMVPTAFIRRRSYRRTKRTPSALHCSGTDGRTRGIVRFTPISSNSGFRRNGSAPTSQLSETPLLAECACRSRGSEAFHQLAM